MGKKVEKRKLSKEELLSMLVDQENKEIRQMDEMVDLLITKNVSIDVNSERNDNLTIGQKMADAVARFAGSWGFIMTFAIFILIWISINAYFINKPFDEYPFVFLNLVLGCIVAIQSPIIMMSQNRMEEKDRIRSENDYKINLKAEFILEDMYNKLNKLIKRIEEIEEKLKK